VVEAKSTVKMRVKLKVDDLADPNTDGKVDIHRSSTS
jgi:hypothetical protein